MNRWISFLTILKGRTEFEFVNDLMVQDAVIRRFEIVGEASSKISDKVKHDNSRVQWRLMKEMRNKLIHEYFGVSAITIYSTIMLDLPVLREQIDALVLREQIDALIKSLYS